MYRAVDSALQRDVAIKILHERIADDSLRDEILREGRALAKVEHDNVVRVIGIEEHGDRVGLCMDFVQGETLESVMKRTGVFNHREATMVGQDICRALAAVHGAGFIHRDVKPRNVMRQRAGRIVLMDFGAGCQVSRGRDEPVDVIGTPLYMAPEVLAGDPPSARSDVYSVGVLLYHLVCGKYRSTEMAGTSCFARISPGRRTPLSDWRSDLPLAFVKVVTRAIAQDPEQRFQTAGALLEALDLAPAKRNPLRPLAASVAFALAVQVAIFLCSDGSTAAGCATGPVTPEQQENLRALLESPAVAQYVNDFQFESKDDAYKHFKEQFSNSPIVDSVTPDQLPASFRINMKDPEKYQIISETFSSQAGVETVIDQRQLLERLFSAMNAASLVAVSIAGVMIVCAILLIATTIRLSAFSRRRETGIMRLVGASKMVIQLPFILEGVIAAVIGAALASGTLWAVAQFFLGDYLSRQYPDTAFISAGQTLLLAPALIGMGALLAGSPPC